MEVAAARPSDGRGKDSRRAPRAQCGVDESGELEQ